LVNHLHQYRIGEEREYVGDDISTLVDLAEIEAGSQIDPPFRFGRDSPGD
jgi:hypothetical protein